jgi:hypothetical protein
VLTGYNYCSARITAYTALASKDLYNYANLQVTIITRKRQFFVRLPRSFASASVRALTYRALGLYCIPEAGKASPGLIFVYAIFRPCHETGAIFCRKILLSPVSHPLEAGSQEKLFMLSVSAGKSAGQCAAGVLICLKRGALHGAVKEQPGANVPGFWFLEKNGPKLNLYLSAHCSLLTSPIGSNPAAGFPG